MYDLHDGLGVQTKTNECSVTTSKQVPSISFIPYNISQTSVEYNLLISDNNVTGRVNLITLYNGVTFVKRLNNLDTKITDLDTNTTYTVKINYVYDFDDGFGSREINVEYEFTTLKKDATYSLTFNDINKQGFSLSHNLIDEDNVCSFKEINIYQDNTLVKKVTDKLETKVSNLLSDTLYKVVVSFDKNLNNGMETSNYIYYVTTEKYQTPNVNINLTSTKTSINYDYEIIDNDGIGTINSVELYYNGQKADIISDKNVFSNLFSDSLYTIKISLLCDYHNGKEKQVEEYTKQIKTLPVDDITFEIEVTPQKRKIIYNHSVIDVDNIMSVKEVRLYRGNTLISTNYSLDNKVFDNLYSNMVYKIVYVIEKDLNNNSDKVIVEFSKEVTTLALDIPTLDLDLTSTIDTINYEFQIVDNDFTLILEKLLVYKNNQLIKTITDFNDKTITDLESNTTYMMELSYKYDLNDLQGLSSGEITKEYTTLASEVEVTEVSLLNSVNPKTNQNVNLNIKLNNPSKVNITYVNVNNEILTVNGGDGINNVIVTLKTQRMSGDMEVVVKRLGYIINNETIEQAITKNNNLTFKVFSRLDIVEINLVNGNDVDKANDSFGYVITIDNPNNYIVKKITLDGDVETIFSQDDNSLVMIDNNHFYINDINLTNNQIIIKSIVYVDSDNIETIRNYTDSVEVNNTKILPDSITNALIIHQISTPEEFMNMEVNLAYELINDIDMTGYNWTCKSFYGYFNGNGYKVKNLSYVHEDEWEFDEVKNRQVLNLFNFSGSFTFKNVYFENIYVDINTTCLQTLNPWESYKNREGYTHLFSYNSSYETETTNFKNVSLSGYVNIKSGEEMVGGFELYNDSIYIVDHLTVNNEAYAGNNLISYETFNNQEFRENTLNWNFIEKSYDNYEGIDYYIVDNSYIIIEGFSGTSSDLVIPEEINGIPVIGINDLAFVNNLTIKSAQLPNSLCYVGASIFSGCSNLEKLIYLNTDLRFVGELFGGKDYNGSYLTQLNYCIPRKLSHLELGSKSGIIRDYQCYGYTSLKTLIIQEGVTSLNSYSFTYCYSLTNIVLPNTLETIFGSVFETCGNLQSIFIPKSVTTIYSSAFNSTNSLTMYCEAESKPDGWNIDFESLYITVIYGYKK